MEKLHVSKTFMKMSGGRMHTPDPTLLAISYKNHQKSLAYFSHLIGTINFALLYQKAESKEGEGMAQCSSLNTLLSLRLGG